jgi:hypothetical protein
MSITIGESLRAILKAMPQLTKMTFQRETSLYFRCPYQAKAIKTLNKIIKIIVFIKKSIKVLLAIK